MQSLEDLANATLSKIGQSVSEAAGKAADRILGTTPASQVPPVDPAAQAASSAVASNNVITRVWLPIAVVGVVLLIVGVRSK